jgi:hypothetical protein
MTLLM